MTTSTDVVNESLQYLGDQTQITSLTDGSVAANAASVIYAPVWQMVARQLDPDFARLTASLTEITGNTTYNLPNHTRAGYTGNCTSASCYVESDNGAVTLLPKGGASSVSFATNGSNQNLINVNPLPTAPPSGTGLGYLCFDNAGNLYAKSSCP